MVDAAWTAPFLLLYVLALPASIGTAVATPALLLPLVLRRRFPLSVFAVVAAVALLKLVFGSSPTWADFAVIVALYTVAAHCRFVWALAASATVELGLVLMLVQSPYAGWSDWNAFATYTFLIMLCSVTGLYANVRRSYLRGLEERAEWLERERDARAQAAIAEERARIAREMHDVVAHNLSVMVVQADGAAFAIDTDPARAKGALETVSETGRSALAEMRGILGVLRDGAQEDGYAPRPGVQQLDRLIDQMRRAGLPVALTVGGVERQLPAGVELAVYRVVQEALTNTLKHAGPAVSRARVQLHYGDSILEVRVVDDGRGAASAANGAGHGLQGMRERVAAYDGSVRAGPRAGGGYEVVAALPLRPAAA
ncbi:sensor histidine kinase [Streptomonospora sediminis]